MNWLYREDFFGRLENSRDPEDLHFTGVGGNEDNTFDTIQSTGAIVKISWKH